MGDRRDGRHILLQLPNLRGTWIERSKVLLLPVPPSTVPPLEYFLGVVLERNSSTIHALQGHSSTLVYVCQYLYVQPIVDISTFCGKKIRARMACALLATYILCTPTTTYPTTPT
jgi:hypothetical protein